MLLQHMLLVKGYKGDPEQDLDQAGASWSRGTLVQGQGLQSSPTLCAEVSSQI